ncbi:SNF2 family protein [Diplocarpon rosae]|nr:SNF2 family protein [Diplocarpon rosae]
MASKSDRPSLRVLYTQGERDELLRSLIPKPPNLNAEDFRKALKLSEADFELVEAMVNLSFEKSGLSEFQSLREPDALIAMNSAVLEPVTFLARVLPDVPEWFTATWCTQIIQYLWQKRVDLLEAQREEIRRGKKRIEAAPAFGQGMAMPTMVSLRNMTFQLVMARSERGSKVFVEELASVRCLTRGKSANEASSYSLVDFIREFEAIINSTRQSPLRLLRGALSYRTKAGTSRPIQRQQQFEVALNDMFNARGEQYVLKFHHREENATERNARLAADKAARRLKEEARVPATNDKEKSKPKQSATPERGRSPGPRKQRRRSPPPSTPPTRPLPPIPTITLLEKEAAVFNPSERAAIQASEVKLEAERAKSRAARPTAGRSGSRAREAKAEAEKAIRKGERSTPGSNKPLPPLPASTSTKSSVRRPSPLVSRSGPRIPRGSPAPAAEPTRDHTSPPLSNAINKVLQRGKKVSIAASSGSGNATSQSSAASDFADTRERGASRPGQHIPVNEPTAAGHVKAQLSVPQVKPVAATELPEIVVPVQEQVSHFSDSEPEGAEAETLSGDRRILKSRAKYAKKGLSPVAPPTLKEAATKTLYKGMRPIGYGIQVAGRRVSHLVSMVSPPSPRPKEVPGYYSGSPRVSATSAVERVVMGSKGTKAVQPRVPTSRFAAGKKIDRWEQQHRRYKDSHEVIATHTYRRGGDEYVDDKADLFKEMESELEVGEADERGEDVDLDDAERAKTRGEYMTQQLQKMQNLPELAQMYDHGFAPPFPESPGPPRLNTRWVECCQLFQRDPSSTSIDERVQLAGLKTPLYLYQAFGVYWQMKTGRAVGGGFVADEMGLGKTLSFLAYFVAERQLAMLQWEMANPTKPNPANVLKHSQLHLEDGKAGPGVICPSQKSRGPGWIACPCASPVTSALIAKPGVRLACVPPSLVPTWIAQWNTHIDEGNLLLLLRLIIAHDGSNEKPVGGGYDLRDVRHASNEKRMLAHRNTFDSTLHDHSTEFFEDGAQYHQERLLVLTTREYWVKHLAKKYERKSARVWSPAESKWTSGVRPGIVYGMAMIDECHEEFQKNKGRSGVLSTLPRSGRPFVWGYSGTPLTTSPRGIEGVLWAIEILWPKSYRKNLRNLTGLEQEITSGLELFSCQRLDAICRQFEDHIKENRGSATLFKDIYLRFKPFLMMFMLRRTADTPWFGQPLIKLPPHVHQDIILRHNPEYDGKIEQFEWTVQAGVDAKLSELQEKIRVLQPRRDDLPQQFGFNADMRLRSPLRLMASFPFLVTLAAAEHPEHLDLTWEELKKFRGANEKRKANPYFHHLKAITESSPKIMWLYSFLTELEQTRDVNDAEHKVVIMSEFNQVALIVKLWIEHHLKDKSQRVGLVYAGMSPRSRQATIDSFTDARDDKSHRIQRADFQFLVGTTRIIGAGLQLTRSCHVVLMEPDCEFYRELQGYARVHRLGQRNPTSRSYRLVDAGNRWERRILERQAERGEFPGRADGDEESIHRYGDVTELISQSAPASPREDEGWMSAVLARFPPPAGSSAVVPATAMSERGRPAFAAKEGDLYSAD